LYPDPVVFRVAELFIDVRKTATEVVSQVHKEYVVRGRVTRETVYDIVDEAIARRFVQMTPPVDRLLAERLEKKYPNITAATTHVVQMAGPQDDDKVAKIAADLAFQSLREIKAGCPNRPVGIGLGPGRATRDFCLHFSHLLQNNPDAPAVRLVAISGGGPSYSPEFASTSFFNLFPGQLFARDGTLPEDDRLKIGLFSESLVKTKNFEAIKACVGVKEAVAAAASGIIDLVVTAMGDIDDPHDLLARSLVQSGVDLNELRARTGMVGNVQYRPYSDQGPIKENPEDWRAVTLFEIDDLVRLASQRHKHVILIARQCGMCGKSRARAVRPLVSLPHMKVFSHLVVDSKTAGELLQDEVAVPAPSAHGMTSPTPPAATVAPAGKSASPRVKKAARRFSAS
jgi:DNA-binding transcriptional regulator LsrR (DeoR family)